MTTKAPLPWSVLVVTCPIWEPPCPPPQVVLVREDRAPDDYAEMLTEDLPGWRNGWHLGYEEPEWSRTLLELLPEEWVK